MQIVKRCVNCKRMSASKRANYCEICGGALADISEEYEAEKQAKIDKDLSNDEYIHWLLNSLVDAGETFGQYYERYLKKANQAIRRRKRTDQEFISYMEKVHYGIGGVYAGDKIIKLMLARNDERIRCKQIYQDQMMSLNVTK